MPKMPENIFAKMLFFQAIIDSLNSDVKKGFSNKDDYGNKVWYNEDARQVFKGGGRNGQDLHEFPLYAKYYLQGDGYLSDGMKTFGVVKAVACFEGAYVPYMLRPTYIKIVFDDGTDIKIDSN